jgi:hypothetical protein
MVQSQPRQIVGETLSQKIGLMEWLKVKALSPSTTKKKMTFQNYQINARRIPEIKNPQRKTTCQRCSLLTI